MKKGISLILALSLALCLCACGSSQQTPAAPNAGTPSAGTPNADTADKAPESNEPVQNTPVQEEGFVFTYNGVDITMNAPAADILAALGEPKTYTERTSCAFDGLDKTYYFGSFYLQTYPVGDEDFIFCLWIVDDTVTTEEGIYIGASQQEVEDTYGAESFDGINTYSVTKGDSSLTVILTNGSVSSIQYDAITE